MVFEYFRVRRLFWRVGWRVLFFVIFVIFEVVMDVDFLFLIFLGGSLRWWIKGLNFSFFVFCVIMGYCLVFLSCLSYCFL